ncbi:unnamed protein product [Somion occarium]|uniref:Creatinase/aminopeptidase n=1 Tax=Somion occarium TaxID=3059160 RepID=A0ABP1DDR1_9APHY
MAPPPPPPPPPPPICLPFIGKKKPKRLPHRLERANSYSPTATLTSKAEKLSFSTDTESYDVAGYVPAADRTVLKRANTMGEKTKALPPINEKSGGGTKKWIGGYGWGLGKKDKEKEIEREREAAIAQLSRDNSFSSTRSPPHRSPRPSRRASDRSVSTSSSQPAQASAIPGHMQQRGWQGQALNQSPNHSRSNTFKSQSSGRSQNPLTRRPGLFTSDSSSTLVGSALERKINDANEVDSYRERPDTSERLEALRELMTKDQLDYYVIPSQDAHGSEYVGVNDKRVEWVSGFTGSVGTAIISTSRSYLIVDSRYWTQAEQQTDNNWLVIRAGDVDRDAPKDWVIWLVDRVKESRIGIDARMIEHRKATDLNSQLVAKKSKLVYPPQNLIDLIWKEKPSRSKEAIFVQPLHFTGQEAGAKLEKLRQWIKEQKPSVSSYAKSEPKPANKQVATLVSNLACIAWLLNLRGDDIPFNPVFYSYLFVSADQALLFVDSAKVSREVDEYLSSIGVERREYNDIWTFLRRKEWGEGKIIISPQTSYAISLMLTSYRYTVLPSPIEDWKAIKNPTELQGLRNAYLRDGAAYVRWLAWLEDKMNNGYNITEYEAAWRLTEYRRQVRHYKGLAYENISATGSNAAIPHYTPHKRTAVDIERDTPYLNDSGGQYRDGTCDTTRTVHFGLPTSEQCEAFTRVLQGHIAIDSAIFPEGTDGLKLDVLARRALWQDGLNYGHGTGHGVGSYLNVHEGPHGFSSTVPLEPGHVVTNEPGYYKEGDFGIRIESALIVRPVQTKHEFNGPIWLGFERLTCVPIQTKMVKDSMLSKEEKQWLKDHNRLCFERLEPLIKDDKRALKWLKREANRGIGLASPVGGMHVEW